MLCKQYVEAKLLLVRKTTFLFMPNGSLRLDEPPYSQIDADLVSELHKFLFLNAGLGNRCLTKTGVKFKVCVACALQGQGVAKSEVYLILGCPQYAAARDHLGLADRVQGIVSQHGEGEKGYGAYWWKGQNLHVKVLKWRLQCAVYRDLYLDNVLVLKPIYYR